MNGADLRNWLEASRIDSEVLAAAIGLSGGSVYRLLNHMRLDKRTILALAHLGCPQAQHELSEDTGVNRLKVSQAR